jgi:hypothetical protein
MKVPEKLLDNNGFKTEEEKQRAYSLIQDVLLKIAEDKSDMISEKSGASSQDLSVNAKPFKRSLESTAKYELTDPSLKMGLA